MVVTIIFLLFTLLLSILLLHYDLSTIVPLLVEWLRYLVKTLIYLLDTLIVILFSIVSIVVFLYNLFSVYILTH